MKEDTLSVIEAAYRLEPSGPAWLRGIAQTAYQQLNGRHGLFAFQYQVHDDFRLSMSEALDIEMPDALLPLLKAGFEAVPPDFVRRTFVKCECTTRTDAEKHDPRVREYNAEASKALAEQFGWRDILMLGGMDPEGHGIYLGAWLPKSTGLRAQFRTRWTRVAVHLTTALRLRRRLSDNSAGGAASEAVITPAGRIEHAEGEAKGSDARTALRKAVLDVERARGSRTRNPDRAVAGWKGLVSARWTLVEQFESDGKRYVLARRNDVRVPGDERLTTREEQILGFAVLGHTDKLIAYSMGIAHSTVRVLMHRAARKLAANTRAELLDKYRTRAVKSGGAQA